MSTRKDKSAAQDTWKAYERELDIAQLNAEIRRLRERNEQLTSLAHKAQEEAMPAAGDVHAEEFGHLWEGRLTMNLAVPARQLAYLLERANCVHGLMDLMRRDHMASHGSDGPGILTATQSGAVLSAALMLSEQMNETLIELGQRAPAKAGAA